MVRFKNPLTGEVSWEDKVRGLISISNEEIISITPIVGTNDYVIRSTRIFNTEEALTIKTILLKNIFSAKNTAFLFAQKAALHLMKRL